MITRNSYNYTYSLWRSCTTTQVGTEKIFLVCVFAIDEPFLIAEISLQLEFSILIRNNNKW